MPSSQSNLLNTPGAGAGVPHFHRDDDLLCPLCEQPIPDERADEIQERIALRENERNAAVEARLKDLFAREKSEAVSAARAAERKAADEKAAKKIADAESVHRQMLVEIQRGAEKARADHEAALAKAEADFNGVAVKIQSAASTFGSTVGKVEQAGKSVESSMAAGAEKVAQSGTTAGAAMEKAIVSGGARAAATIGAAVRNVQVTVQGSPSRPSTGSATPQRQ